MLAIGLLRWWYGSGWLTLLRKLKQRLSRIFQTFSVGLLLKTLFKPWKQITAPPDPNATIGERLRGKIDNLVSRFVGLGVRVFTFIAAMVVALITTIIGLALVIAWPAVPIAVVILVLKGAGAL